MEGEKLQGGWSLHIYSFSLFFFSMSKRKRGTELSVFKNQVISKALNLEINN